MSLPFDPTFLRATKRQREPENKIEVADKIEEDPDQYEFADVDTEEKEFQPSGTRTSPSKFAMQAFCSTPEAANRRIETPTRTSSLASQATQAQIQAPYNGDIPIKDLDEFRRVVRMRKELDRRIREFIGETQCPLCGCR
jgi:hypothetical protein